MNTKDGNLLIAKYMGAKIRRGWEHSTDPMYDFPKAPKFNSWCLAFGEKWVSGEDFVEHVYHTSFDWLIPVVMKIESSSGTDFNITGNCVKIGDKEFVGDSKIEAIWNAVVWWISQQNNI